MEEFFKKRLSFSSEKSCPITKCYGYNVRESVDKNICAHAGSKSIS